MDDVSLKVLNDPAGRRGGRSSPSAAEVVQRWTRAFNAADSEGLSALYAESATLDCPIDPPCESRQEIEAHLAQRFRDYAVAGSRASCTIENLVEAGPWAILEWRDGLALPACSVFRCENGRIQTERDYWDLASYRLLYGD